MLLLCLVSEFELHSYTSQIFKTNAAPFMQNGRTFREHILKKVVPILFKSVITDYIYCFGIM